MALTHANHVTPVASEVLSLCTRLKEVYKDACELLDTNSDLSIDWAAGAKPDYINEDTNGNLDGFGFERSEIANAIGSLNQLRNLLENLAVSQGDHLGNLNKVSNVST